MSKNIDQIFTANPITSNLSTDLMYFGQSPYAAGNDAAMTYSNFSSQFVTTAGLGTGVATALGQSVTGSGGIALANTPTFTTPALGAATATSINFGQSTLNIYRQDVSWTPVFTFATVGNLSVAYTTQAGIYTRVGSIVIANFTLSFTPTFTTSSGNVEITGLPYTSNSTTANQAIGHCLVQTVTFPTGVTSIVLQINNNTNFILLSGSGSAVSSANFTTTQFISGTAYTITGTIAYAV